ncbi:hypothetical protein [Pseudaminobacter soli (ex Li et al. 2025)]|uniref:Uncharacterized protein n=1 Tax=Pseudaminobacter soli (ex Li et al. 2025) TaxID=1295366 RepID=A0A2P7S1E7_9HYPH|nr:hypothetical protein [Mesorhizobium soli]PSJ56279.1 hypothetical protein C7I85_25280 [Mesorhizobium soli]
MRNLKVAASFLGVTPLAIGTHPVASHCPPPSKQTAGFFSLNYLAWRCCAKTFFAVGPSVGIITASSARAPGITMFSPAVIRNRTKVFTPENVSIMRHAVQRIRAERRLPSQGADAERLASKALDLFKAGYIREAALTRALREDA